MKQRQYAETLITEWTSGALGTCHTNLGIGTKLLVKYNVPRAQLYTTIKIGTSFYSVLAIFRHFENGNKALDHCHPQVGLLNLCAPLYRPHVCLDYACITRHSFPRVRYSIQNKGKTIILANKSPHIRFLRYRIPTVVKKIDPATKPPRIKPKAS